MESSFTLQEIFSPDGLLDRQLPDYEFRPTQLKMALSVLEAIQNGHALCAEAGTGTGKTLAYLIPAIASRKRAIISTATRNLQEQLFSKDIPFLKKHLFPDMKVSYMKGRQNYLCLKKLQEMGLQHSQSREYVQTQQTLTAWAGETETGDRSELDSLPDSNSLWRMLDARSESCIGQKCDSFNHCFITRMRHKAQESDIVIVNHALFFAHLALEVDELGKILPDFSILILDEGHAIEDIACTHLGKRISSFQVEDLARDLFRSFSDESLSRTIQELESNSEALFSSFPPSEGNLPLNSVRGSDKTLTDLRVPALPAYQQLSRTLSGLHHELSLRDPTYQERDMLLRRLESLALHLEKVFDMEDDDSVLWMQRRGRGTFLNLTPIDVSSILRERLFSTTPCTILVSATLTTNGDFSYVRGRLGLDETQEIVADDEFDYPTQSLLYIPSNFPEPGSPGYLSSFVFQLKEILSLTEGHAFLLFTSFQQLNRVHDLLHENLPYPLLRQGDRPKSRLLDEFRKTPSAVLCATSSFWQGVDVPGDSLRAVVIDKLPFLVPTEPVVEARIHRIEKQGDNSFLQYSLPAATIALKQGLGRLIRSRQDRGVLGVFDSRLRTRSYGRLFLQSLPNFPVTDTIGVVQSLTNEWWPKKQDSNKTK